MTCKRNNSFIQGQFNYCPLVWMFSSRASNNQINKLHERSLNLALDNYTSSYGDLLRQSDSVPVHIKNIQALMIEIYKLLNGLSPPIMNDLFNIREMQYNLRNFRELQSYNVRTVRFGLETISFKGPQLWQQLPEDIKNSDSLNLFKHKIKSWKNPNCPCRACRDFIQGLGFI